MKVSLNAPVSVVLLGAGLSTRMGRCKALLPWRGKTVLESVCAAYEAVPGDRILVAGAEAATMASLVAPFGFRTVVNPEPSLGQGHSLALGLSVLQQSGPVLCGVTDQPLLTARTVGQIMNFHEAARQLAPEPAVRIEQDAQVSGAEVNAWDCLITVPRYGAERSRGNPVLFGPYWRDPLGRLTGDEGGRVILRGPGRSYIQFCDIAAAEGDDIDTPEAYAKLLAVWGTV